MCLGIPGRIVAITDPDAALATVEIAGVRRPVNISFVLDERPIETCVGEWVLVHVGFAMSRLDPAEAERTLALLADLEEFQEEMAAMQSQASDLSCA